jgi:tellurite resistance protein TerC
MRLFHYLHYGLSAILVFVGAKMLLADVYELPVGVALGIIAGILLIAAIASVIRPHQRDVVTTPADPLR